MHELLVWSQLHFYAGDSSFSKAPAHFKLLSDLRQRRKESAKGYATDVKLPITLRGLVLNRGNVKAKLSMSDSFANTFEHEHSLAELELWLIRDRTAFPTFENVLAGNGIAEIEPCLQETDARTEPPPIVAMDSVMRARRSGPVYGNGGLLGTKITEGSSGIVCKVLTTVHRKNSQGVRSGDMEASEEVHYLYRQRDQCTNFVGALSNCNAKQGIPCSSRGRARRCSRSKCEIPVIMPSRYFPNSCDDDVYRLATDPFHADIDSLPETLQEQALEIKKNNSAAKYDFEKIDKTLFRVKYLKFYPDIAEQALRLERSSAIWGPVSEPAAITAGTDNLANIRTESFKYFPISLDRHMNEVKRPMANLILHKAEEFTTCIQVNLKQGFQKCSIYREQLITSYEAVRWEGVNETSSARLTPSEGVTREEVMDPRRLNTGAWRPASPYPPLPLERGRARRSPGAKPTDKFIGVWEGCWGGEDASRDGRDIRGELRTWQFPNYGAEIFCDDAVKITSRPGCTRVDMLITPTNQCGLTRTKQKSGVEIFGRLTREPTKVKRREYGAAPEFMGWVNGISPRKTADQRHRPARFRKRPSGYRARFTWPPSPRLDAFVHAADTVRLAVADISDGPVVSICYKNIRRASADAQLIIQRLVFLAKEGGCPHDLVAMRLEQGAARPECVPPCAGPASLDPSHAHAWTSYVLNDAPRKSGVVPKGVAGDMQNPPPSHSRSTPPQNPHIDMELSRLSSCMSTVTLPGARSVAPGAPRPGSAITRFMTWEEKSFIKKVKCLKKKNKKEDMIKAIEAIKSGECGYMKAAKKYNVPRSTLARNDIENQLVDYILEMEAKFFGLTPNDNEVMAYQLATRNGIKHPFGEGKDGRGWLDHFLAWHSDKISLRKPTGTSAARALGFTAEKVNIIFDNLD
ncbi:hypothetical protein PR048_015175 [Dryococelus australis]|uniref:HTH psq-type domain-containing protein n=1 Tax=Dryococelus australis TaxID=614101 RepID=A0ABQ9HG74_9NEOP|nr:hypothetical protein PR048_015175 [Dryococelus australis]